MKANAFASTFLLFADTQCQRKKIKKSLQAKAHGHCKLDKTDLRQKRTSASLRVPQDSKIKHGKQDFVRQQ